MRQGRGSVEVTAMNPDRSRPQLVSRGKSNSSSATGARDTPSCSCHRSGVALRILIPSRKAGSGGYSRVAAQPRRPSDEAVCPMTGTILRDLAGDIGAVIEHDRNGPAFVVGHAFGNRVAGMLATDRPDLVTRGLAGRRQCGPRPEPPCRA